MDDFRIDDLVEQCKNDTQLFGIMFVLLSKCNHNCVHCYIPGHTSPGLPTDKIKKCIDEAHSLGALNVTFTGGEILLRDDLLELIRYARKKYMRVFLMSNAYALDEQYVRELANLYITEFSTTVFSLDPSIHDAITRVPGSLNKVLKNIELLHKHNICVTIKTPLMQSNRFSYRDVEKYAQSNGYSFRTSPSIFSKTDGETTPHNYEIQTDLRAIVGETDAINGQYQGEIISRNDGDIPCFAGHSNICINYDGNVWPCNTLTLCVGNIHQSTLNEIWHHSEALNNWRKKCRQIPGVCLNCNLHKHCIRCPGLAYMEDGDLYGCSSTAKKIAEHRI